ncbi:MAG: hypothetical protein ACJZZ7_04090 [Cytophagales bacterium]|nr:MAG: hypothetical protein CNE34_05515 [Rhodothermaeota bacterium MED-G18]|tara:strand:+ start:174 stop:515 length:342 start_codon:yes stop_codon:yes gene_type:complete
MSLSSTAEAIKHYKVTFNWKTGFESWSKVPTTMNYHMLAPNLGLEATGADEIRDIIFGFCTENELEQELVDIIEHGQYVTCMLNLKTKSGDSIQCVEVFLLDEEGRVDKIWAL